MRILVLYQVDFLFNKRNKIVLLFIDFQFLDFFFEMEFIEYFQIFYYVDLGKICKERF